MTPRGPLTALEHPDVGDLDLLRVLHALSDPTRMQLVTQLWDAGERPCGTFDVEVAPSTLSHHFKVLREAGVVRQRMEGRERITTLRADDLDARFPGLIGSLVDLYRL